MKAEKIKLIGDYILEVEKDYNLIVKDRKLVYLIYNEEVIDVDQVLLVVPINYRYTSTVFFNSDKERAYIVTYDGIITLHNTRLPTNMYGLQNNSTTDIANLSDAVNSIRLNTETHISISSLCDNISMYIMPTTYNNYRYINNHIIEITSEYLTGMVVKYLDLKFANKVIQELYIINGSITYKDENGEIIKC